MVLWLEVRRAARAIVREPAVAAAAVLALGLGIGLPTAMFSLIDATVLRGLPVEEGKRVMHLERRPHGATGEGWGAAARDYLGWREQQRSFEDLAAFRTGTVTLRAERGTDRWNAGWVTPNAFAVLREVPALGRTFDDNETGAVVLGHDLWRDRFGSDPAALGRTVWVDGAPHTVVGVMPAAFRFPGDEDLWLPLAVDARAEADPSFGTMDVFGRLHDGLSGDDARAEFAVIAARMAQDYPATNRDMGVAVKPYTERFLGETATRQMWIMLGAVMLVLVVACTNVANLLIVRVVHRVRELAILSALGGSRRRIVGGVLAESLLLSLTGAALGLLVALGAVRALEGVFAGRMPYWAEPRVDGSALLFALALAAAAALLAGMLPALRATRGDTTTLLQDQARGSTSLRLGRVMHGLVVLEVALSLALLVATGLLARGVWNVRSVDFGFATESLATARVSLADDLDDAGRLRFYDELRARLGADAAVAAVGLGTTLPGDRAARPRFAVEGQSYASDDARPRARLAEVDAGFFETFGVRAVHGRLFGAQDGPDGLPVAVVNERFVARYFEGRDAIGARIRFGDDSPWRTIVGVIPDLWMGGLDAQEDRNPAGVYVPLAQSAPSSVALAVRARTGAPSQLFRTLREAAFAVDPDVPLYEVRTHAELVRDNSWFYGFGAGIMGATGLAALMLAAIGLYGVIAFTVGKRLREFGVRMALGATGRNIVTLVMRRGALQVGIGVAFGLALAVLLGGGLSTLLFDVDSVDPLVYGAISLLLAAVAGFAMLVPALRAARVSPLRALRID